VPADSPAAASSAEIPAEDANDPFALAGWASGVMLADVITVVAPDSARIMYYMYDLPEGYDARGLLGPVRYEKGNRGPGPVHAAARLRR